MLLRNNVNSKVSSSLNKPASFNLNYNYNFGVHASTNRVFTLCRISKRFMHRVSLASTRCNSSRSLAKSFYDSGTRVYYKPYVHRSSIREMAVRTGNKAETPSVKCSPRAFSNNPLVKVKGKVVRHAETHLQKCNEDQNCSQKTCSKLCGTPGKRIALEHWTHGHPQTSAGPVVPVSSTDYNGNTKQQNAIVYHVPHETSVTQEIPALTSFLNQPNVVAAVEPHENP